MVRCFLSLTFHCVWFIFSDGVITVGDDDDVITIEDDDDGRPKR